MLASLGLVTMRLNYRGTAGFGRQHLTSIREGIDTIFGLPGVQMDWVFDAIHEERDYFKVYHPRHEQACVYMADGYARVSGRPGFVYGQRGPGVANVAAAMADPYWAFSPVISLTTSIMNRSRDRYEYQDVDGMPMHAPTCRWNKSLAAPQRAAAMTRAAIRAATGPVFNDDVLPHLRPLPDDARHHVE